jgi:mono/diheme cytochrome c family protein
MKKHMTNHTNHSNGKIRIALMLSAGMALAGLAGCGQGSGASQSSSASDSAPEQTPAVEQAAATPTPPSSDHGRQLFATACATCHGPQGQGIPHLGKDLQTSQFVSGLGDDKLVDFITEGRPTSDPLNTTHVPMPPKGGNPALSSQDISDIVAYVRQLQQQQHMAAK